MNRRKASKAEGDTLIVEDLMKKPPETDAELNRVLNLIDRCPLYEKLLVSDDRSMTSILIKAQAVKEVLKKISVSWFHCHSW